MRALALSVEGCLAVASVVAFGALITPGSRSGRIAWRAMTWGAWAALVGAILTLLRRVDDVWLMDAWNTQPASQLLKALILAGLLASLMLARRETDAWTDARAIGPFFRLVAVSALVAAVSAGDLLVLWLSLDIASAALVLLVASDGRWSTREKTVRRMLAVWVPSSLVMLLGVILLAAIGGGTRYLALEHELPAFRSSPIVIGSLVLVAGGILVRALRLTSLLLAVRRA